MAETLAQPFGDEPKGYFRIGGNRLVGDGALNGFTETCSSTLDIESTPEPRIFTD